MPVAKINYNSILNIILEDNNDFFGKKSSANETLGEFLMRSSLPLNLICNKKDLNKELKECGIVPVDYADLSD